MAPDRAPPELEQRWSALLERQPDLDHLDALLIDLCGIVRGKRYPRADAPRLLRGGFPIPSSVYYLDVTGACLDPLGRGFSDGDPDAMAVPVAGTLVPVPWSERPAAQVLMTLDDGGDPRRRVDPRAVAAAVLERFLGLGLRPRVAFELEFYVFDPRTPPGAAPRPPPVGPAGRRAASTQVYGLEELDEVAPFVAEVVEAAAAQGIPASVATSEYAPGQLEINLRHVDDALAAADHCALLRRVVRCVARRHGLRASFMAKPRLDLTGSGMHVHLSLVGEDGENRFDDGTELGSPLLRGAVAGLLDTLYDALALFAPNPNAMRRFVPGQFVPMGPTWAPNNRAVAVRIPAGPPAARRIEHRVAGADANPYLVLAAILAGIEHGLERGLDPGEPTPPAACHEADPARPAHLAGALDRLERSEVLAERLGRDYLSLYAATKRAELERFERYVSPRELEWYL